MTGEITLRGAVLPVGGIKEKILAAHRAGLTRVILPKQNGKDLVEIPKQIQKEMKFNFVKEMSEVLDLAICK
jgi:ATP-dependent Lon protease